MGERPQLRSLQNGHATASLLFRRCPVAIPTKRGANRAGHPGRRLNCALERSSVSVPPVTFRFPAEHSFIPFHCAGDLAWGGRPDAGESTAEFLAFLFENEGHLDWLLAPHILQDPCPGNIDRSRLSANRRQIEARRNYH